MTDMDMLNASEETPHEIARSSNVSLEGSHMTIDEQGFLSPEIAAWIDKHRAENRAWFSLAMNLNSVAQQELLLLEVPSGDNKAFLAALLFVRGLTSFQAAVLLAERGMVQDARTITRSCFESVFCFGALRNDPSFLEKFEKGDVHGKKKFAKALLEGSSTLEAGVAEKLSQFLNDLKQSGENGAPLNMEQAAKSAGLGAVYDAYYRGLSNDAAHPSHIALKRYCAVDENNEFKGFQWGPDVKDVEEALIASCTACWYLVVWMAERVEHPEIKEKLDRCSEEYKQLIEAAKAADLNGAPTRAPPRTLHRHKSHNTTE
jgi:Family of unknown function (DUF5677)